MQALWRNSFGCLAAGSLAAVPLGPYAGRCFPSTVPGSQEIVAALLEKHRSVIYAHLVEHVGEEAAEAMLAQFPSRDLDEPVTKEFVALQVAELRTDLLERFNATDNKINTQTERLLNRVQLMAGLLVIAFTVISALFR